MKNRLKLIALLLGVLLVLGLPPLLFVAALSPAEESVAAAASNDPLRALIGRQSNLERFYLGWQKSYLARGGDRSVEIAVAWTESLSTEPGKARGRVRLDLLGGAVRAEIQGLDGQAADLWLVDNQEGPGMTVQPQPGDRMLKVASLRTNGGVAEASARLAPGLFRGFELDLVVISRPGRTPAESSILVGTRPFFERLYTRTRLAMEKTRARNARLFEPASLLTLLSPRLAEAGPAQILAANGLVSQAVADGADLFFRGTFGGNGRTCGTCHRAENNLGLDVDFISTLPADDKLFLAEFPASQGGVPGLERPLLMRGHAQVLMNVDGFENPTAKFTMRAVPHTLSLSRTIGATNPLAPVQRTGWSGDGAPGSGALRLLPNTAVKQHFTKSLDRLAGTDFVLPTDAQLDKMEAFMLACGRLNELNLFGISLKDTGAQTGKFLFNGVLCGRCHTNAGSNAGGGANNANINTNVELAPDSSQTTEPHPRDGGFGTAGSPNFDCDGDSTLDCFGNGTFNTPSLIEAADTEPFFHNHSAATIEESVAFYNSQAFLLRGFTIGTMTQKDIDDIGAFLRVINAAFNAAISIQRNTAALTLEKNGGPDARETVNMLLALSNSEAMDAIEVLGQRKLNVSSIKLLQNAIAKNNGVIAARSSSGRQILIKKALTDLKVAKAKLGTGLNFTLGEGNLLF